MKNIKKTCWYAVDKDGMSALYFCEPQRNHSDPDGPSWYDIENHICYVDNVLNRNWDDEAIKVNLNIEVVKEKPKPIELSEENREEIRAFIDKFKKESGLKLHTYMKKYDWGSYSIEAMDIHKNRFLELKSNNKPLTYKDIKITMQYGACSYESDSGEGLIEGLKDGTYKIIQRQ